MNWDKITWKRWPNTYFVKQFGQEHFNLGNSLKNQFQSKKCETFQIKTRHIKLHHIKISWHSKLRKHVKNKIQTRLGCRVFCFLQHNNYFKNLPKIQFNSNLYETSFEMLIEMSNYKKYRSKYTFELGLLVQNITQDHRFLHNLRFHQPTQIFQNTPLISFKHQNTKSYKCCYLLLKKY